MIAGVLAPTAGRIEIAGRDRRDDPHALGRLLGYLPEQVPLYGELCPEEYLVFCARLRGLGARQARRAADMAIERCGLGDVRGRLLGRLSKGFQQRAGIAQAIVHDPALLVLDEPASGLDPLQAANIRVLITELKAERAVILSTHLLPDVQACCDRVAILHRGRLRYDGPLESERGFLRVSVEAELDTDTWAKLPGVASAERSGNGWRVQLAPSATPGELASAIVSRGYGLVEFGREHAGLEEIFLRIAVEADVAEAA